jgi:arginyl-tRNA synthetase
MTSFEGDTGPYLQYAHARLCSIERKFAASVRPLDQVDLALLTEPEAAELCAAVGAYPAVVQTAQQQLEPVNIVTYAIDTARVVSSVLEKLWVMNQTPEVTAARLALYTAARITIGNALRVIGLIPVERM